VPIIARHPLWALFVATLLIAAFFITLKVQQFRNFDVRDFDTGIYSNIVWNVATGDGFRSDVLGRHALSEHFSPIVAAFAPVYWVWPSALVLLIAQAIAVAIMFPLLAAVAMRIFMEMKTSTAVALTAALLGMAFFYRPVFSALECEFHPCTLGMPLVAAALLALHADRPRWLIPLVAVLLCTKEMAALSVVGLGIYAGVVLRRPRLAAALIITGIAAGLVIMLAVMPQFRETEWKHLDRLSPGADVDRKFIYLVKLASGLALLPLLGWRALLAALPLTILNLLVSMPNQYSLDFHYDDQNSVFWLAAAAHGMNRLVIRGRHRSWPAHGSLIGIIAAAALVLVVSELRPWKEFRHQCIKTPARVAELREALQSFVNLPPDVGIAATGQLGPQVNLRHFYRRITNVNAKVLARELRPGDLLLISTVNPSPGLDIPRIQKQLKRTRAFMRESSTPLLEVYRRIAPGERAIGQ